MKARFLASALLCFLSLGVHAGIKLPSWVFKTDEMEEAMAEAAEKGKALGFVLTDLGTT